MALNPLRIRRSIVDIGATPEQGDGFAEGQGEGFQDLVGNEDLARALSELEQRLINRLLIAMIGIAAVIISAVALLAQL